MALEEELEEITAWAASAPADEFRFTMFFVPYVITHEGQYLVAYKGQPPERRKIHLAVIPQTRSATSPEDAFEYVKRSGIFGLMSTNRQEDFAKRFKEWWIGPPSSETNDSHRP